MIYAIAIALAVCGVILTAAPMRVLQRGGYRFREYRSGLGMGEYVPVLIGVTVGVLVAYGIGFSGAAWESSFGGVAAGLAIPLFYEVLAPHVPNFKLTARCKRLYLAVVPLQLLTVAALVGLCAGTKTAAWAGFLPAIQFIIVPLSAVMLAPYEKKQRQKFIDGAKARLAKVQPVVIGVTGSYGKTGCKNAIASVLKGKFKNVCASPSSYNTPMGLCLTINKELKDDDRILVAEMGARYSGDIAELTKIAPPHIAVITGIGSQHMETFGTPENLANAKYEIVEGLTTGGVAFFAADEGSKKLAERAVKGSYEIDDPQSPYYVSFYDVTVSERGSRFTILTGGESAKTETRLLGVHNLENLRMACTIGRYFGMTAAELAEGCATTVPTSHRLQLLKKTGKLQVIDDSYNASMEGVRAAVDVLALFPRERAVITPGIVEGGNVSDVQNFRAGCLFAGVCEHAYVYGNNAKSLVKGLSAGGMRQDFIHRVHSRDAAVKMLSAEENLQVVLFSNDLPH